MKTRHLYRQCLERLLKPPSPGMPSGVAAFVAAITTAVSGGDQEAMLMAAETAVQEPEAEAVRGRLALARLGHGPDDFIREQGWVMIALHNAFRHLASGTPIEDALVETVGEGGDTDTNAAICGALLGAAQGRAAIPVAGAWPCWLAALSLRPVPASRGPARYWPDDVPLLAEALLARARFSH
jgi:ADP-ribosyl-[dinitrogen reductase] hydrolase